MSDQSTKPFELRTELRGHLEDVRGVLSCEAGVITASRDKTAKLWVEEGPRDYTCITTFVGHTNYVGPVLYIPAGLSPDYDRAVIVTGSRDTFVKVWDPHTAECLATLQGHAYQITALALLPTGEIVSASLDKTIRVWKAGKCKVLEGHEGPVLSLAVLPGTGELLSGSGDMTIRRWSGQTCVQVFKGHTDTVRGLCALPSGAGFVSASHDLTAKVWSLEGEVLAELVGHTALLYSVAAFDNGLLVTGAEDNTARVWSVTGQCLQTLEHIGCVWDVKFTDNGDIITACADSVARLFTQSDERKASSEAIATYTQQLEEIKKQRAAAQTGAGGGGGGGGDVAMGGGGVDIPGLPPGVKVHPQSAIQSPGAKDGQTLVVKEADGSVWAYAWSVAEFKWEKIGEVVPAPSSGSAGTLKKYHQGQEWDFVFDVDIQEGAPTLKLACNRGENPYIVADRFIEENELPAYFKEQIVQFIIQNTGLAPGQPDLSNMPVTGGGCDPFTGGGSSSSTQQAAPPNAYRPPAVPLSQMPITGGFVDPFTGGGSSSSIAPSPASAGQSQPAATFLVFDNVPPLDKIAAKIREFSAVLASSSQGSSIALTDAESAQLEGLMGVVSRPAALTQAQKGLLEKMLSWPPAQLFPCLDVARLLALQPAAAQALTTLGVAGTYAVLSQAVQLASGAASGGAVVPGTQQTALRLLVNAFKQTELRAWVSGSREQLLDIFASAASTTNKAVRLSWATLLYNYCVLFKSQASTATEDAQLQVLSGLVELVSTCPLDDADSLARSLTALSVLVRGVASLQQVAKDLGVESALRRLHDAPEAKAPGFRPALEAAVQLTQALQ